jgi:GT2 family glycosyltransferase
MIENNNTTDINEDGTAQKLYIIILNWNGTGDTIECLETVKENSYDNYTTIVVDNGSEEQSLNALKKWCGANFTKMVLYSKREAEQGGTIEGEKLLENEKSDERIVIIENKDNLGFAAGNNVALKYMLKSNATFAMLLNNDTLIQKDSLVKLMQLFKQNPDYVAATPQIRYYQPSDRIWNCGGKITWYGNRKYYYAGKKVSKTPQTGFRRITFITGCALIFKPRIAGMLSEKFFFGEEDLDFSFRQKIEKRNIACCFSSVIYHKVSASVKRENVEILGHIYLHYLSRFINIRQYYSPFMFVLAIIINLGYGIPMIVLRYRVNIRQVFNMVLMIVKELKRLDRIDREYCFNCLSEQFKYPITWNT